MRVNVPWEARGDSEYQSQKMKRGLQRDEEEGGDQYGIKDYWDLHFFW